jgi:formimidoylglutamate deiminase
MTWDDAGTLTQVQTRTAADTDVLRAAGVVIPGMPNLHSHAFQRAFAGLAEYRSGNGDLTDSFWTWRELMYRFALNLGPDELEAIATHLYVEMLEAGYTSVCEFQYLHHDPQGHRYGDPAEMSMRLLAAARNVGIGITLLPVLYRYAGFGAVPARPEQRRYINDVDSLLAIAQRLRTQCANGARGDARIGVAPHSIRAVDPESLRHVVSGIRAMESDAPIHIHIAEQQQEVLDSVRWSGQRPVEWLLDHADVDSRWCLVHATHMTDTERRHLAESQAVAGLCPSTEANLGDGVFDASGFAKDGGTWGIGSDSHIGVGAAEELRLLEYSQRLTQQRRNVLAGETRHQVADHLWLSAVRGGAQASGRAIAGIAIGQRADLVALSDGGLLAGLTPSQTLASHVFASHGRNAVCDVWVGGKHRIQDGVHVLQVVAQKNFVAARTKLLSEL